MSNGNSFIRGDESEIINVGTGLTTLTVIIRVSREKIKQKQD